MSALTLKLDKSSPGYEDLLRKIKEKLCESHESVDDSVPTYILHIAGTMHKPKEEVVASLDFLKEDYAKEIVDWAWKLLEDYEKENAQQPVLRSAIAARPSPAKSGTRTKGPGIGRMVVMACKEAKDSVQDRGKKSEDKLAGKRKHDTESNITSTSLSQSQPEPGVRKGRKSIFERLKKRPVEEIKAEEDDDSKKKGKFEASEGEGGKKARCRFWPNCSKGEKCEYWHPTEMCKNFPNCKFGNKCLYLHPQVPCKFGARCMKPNCPYSHPARFPIEYFNPGAFMQYPTMAGGRTKNIKAVYKTEEKVQPQPQSEPGPQQ